MAPPCAHSGCICAQVNDPNHTIMWRIKKERAQAGRTKINAREKDKTLKRSANRLKAITKGMTGKMRRLLSGAMKEMEPNCQRISGMVQTIAAKLPTKDSRIPKESGIHKKYGFH